MKSAEAKRSVRVLQMALAKAVETVMMMAASSVVMMVLLMD